MPIEVDASTHSRRENTANILLIGDNSYNWGALRDALNSLEGVCCLKTECTNVEEAIDRIACADVAISMIFLDLSVFNVDYPKERFLKLLKLVPDLPIVVLTDRTDYDLIHFVMTMGAAETFSLWQLAADSDRLKNIVESCSARARITARQRQLMLLTLSEAEKKHLASQEDSTRDNNAALGKMEMHHTDINRALRKENTVLRNDRDVAYANLQRRRMPIVTGPDSKALAEALEENEKLRADLQAASALLIETVGKSDAVLLYAQEKGRLDLSKIREQNLALRKYNDYAREWLSGNYSTYPKDGDDDDQPGEDNHH